MVLWDGSLIWNHWLKLFMLGCVPPVLFACVPSMGHFAMQRISCILVIIISCVWCCSYLCTYVPYYYFHCLTIWCYKIDLIVTCWSIVAGRFSEGYCLAVSLISRRVFAVCQHSVVLIEMIMGWLWGYCFAVSPSRYLCVFIRIVSVTFSLPVMRVMLMIWGEIDVKLNYFLSCV